MNETLFSFLLFHHLTALRLITAVASTAILFLACAYLFRGVLQRRLLRFTLAALTSLSLAGLFLFEGVSTEARADLAALEALPQTPTAQVTLKDVGNHKIYEVIIPGGPAPTVTSLGSMQVRQMSPAIIRDFDCSLIDCLRTKYPDVFDFVFPTQKQDPKAPSTKSAGPSLRI
jgi:hypothetical protein